MRHETWGDSGPGAVAEVLAIHFGHEKAPQVLVDLPRLAPHGQRRRPTVQNLHTLWRLSRLRPASGRVKLGRRVLGWATARWPAGSDDRTDYRLGDSLDGSGSQEFPDRSRI